MTNFRNIRVKDDTKETKFKVISAIKSLFDLQLIEARDLYYKILNAGEVLYEERNFSVGPFTSNSKCYDPDIFYNANPFDVINLITDYFVSDKEYVKEYDTNDYDYFPSRVPDAETAEALRWFEGLTKEEQNKATLAVEWNRPIAIAGWVA